jgi:Family of unknown function (DUF6518)
MNSLVLPWSHVIFGSLVGPAVGVAVLWLLRERDPRALVAAALGVCAGTWLWNTMLNIRHAKTIDGDIPFRLFPISWQDVGTGVFSFAFAAAIMLATTHRDEPGRRTLKVASVAALAALVMDVYTW